MQLTTLIKALAVATTIVAGTASTTMASSGAYAWADGDVYVFDKYWDIVDSLDDGEKVYVEWCKKGWCWVDKKGEDGFVKKSDLDFYFEQPKKHPKKQWGSKDYYDHGYSDYDYDYSYEHHGKKKDNNYGYSYCFATSYGTVCVQK